MKRLLTVSMLLCIGVFVGCTDLTDFRAAIAGVDTTLVEAQGQLNALRVYQDQRAAEIATMPPGPARAEAVADLAKGERMVAEMTEIVGVAQTARDRLRVSLDKAEDELDVVQLSAQEVARYVPQPWGTLVVLGAGLVTMFLRARRNAVGAREIVQSLDAAGLTEDQKGILSATQPTVAKNMVDEAQGKTASLLTAIGI